MKSHPLNPTATIVKALLTAVFVAIIIACAPATPSPQENSPTPTPTPDPECVTVPDPNDPTWQTMVTLCPEPGPRNVDPNLRRRYNDHMAAKDAPTDGRRSEPDHPRPETRPAHLHRYRPKTDKPSKSS